MRVATLIGGSLALSLAISPARSASPAPMPAQPPTIDRVTQADEVAIRNDGFERMTVAVRVGGAGPYRFLVDTGADRTAISRDMAQELNLATGRGAQLHSISGAQLVATASLPQIELSRNIVHDIEAPVLERANMGADGILGVDSLRSAQILFDFKLGTMSITPANKTMPPDDDEKGAIVIHGHLKNGRLVFADAIVDHEPLTVVVDTGSQVSIGNEALRQRLARRGLLVAPEGVELQSVTGQMVPGHYMIVKQLVVGGVGLKKLAVVFADAHTFEQLHLTNRPALLLGMNAMRAFNRVSIDFANRTLRVVVPEHSDAGNVRLAAR